MSELKFRDIIIKTCLAIDACLEKKLDLPAMVLIYSGIDFVGWLASGSEFASGDTFINWTNSYLLRAKPLKCTALDLWGARCGLVHTMTPYSARSKEGRARLIVPVYGEARAEDMQEFIERHGDAERYVAVHVKDLYEAWRLGVVLFMEEFEKDPGEKERVYGRADKFFSNIDPELLKRALARLL